MYLQRANLALAQFAVLNDPIKLGLTLGRLNLATSLVDRSPGNPSGAVNKMPQSYEVLGRPSTAFFQLFSV